MSQNFRAKLALFSHQADDDWVSRDPAPKQSPEEWIRGELQPLGKNGYWNPPNNLALNFAIMGPNLWVFTILPLFWERKGYRQDLNGIVIHPIWRSVGDKMVGNMNISGFYSMDKNQANKMLKLMKEMPTIDETVRKELTALEKKFGIDIDPPIKSKLLREALATAKRRWGVDRMKVKDRLVPLDGGKPRDLGTSG